MTFPGFPIGLPSLLPGAAELTEAERAYVAALPLDKQREAERSLRNIAAMLNRDKLQPEVHACTGVSDSHSAGRPEGKSLPTNSASQAAKTHRDAKLHREVEEVAAKHRRVA